MNGIKLFLKLIEDRKDVDASRENNNEEEKEEEKKEDNDGEEKKDDFNESKSYELSDSSKKNNYEKEKNELKIQAMKILLNLSGNEVIKNEITSPNLVLSLLSSLQDNPNDNPKLKVEICKLLSNLVNNNGIYIVLLFIVENQKLIFEKNGIEVLLKYLRNDDIDLNIQSCRCLICLTYNYEPNRLVILKSNTNISTVLQCFNKMNNELICYVCKLLCNISCNNIDIMNKVKIDKMIIELLIKVFNLPNIEVKKNSLRCILKFGSDSDYDLKVLNENQIVNELINCLKTKDLILLEMVLDCLYRLTYNCIYYDFILYRSNLHFEF